MLSFPVAEKCRHIDTVTVKGSKLPIELYTFDMDLVALAPSQDKPKNAIKDSKKLAANKRRKISKSITTPQFETLSMFNSSKEL